MQEKLSYDAGKIIPWCRKNESKVADSDTHNILIINNISPNNGRVMALHPKTR